jgi:beta-galactosidase
LTNVCRKFVEIAGELDLLVIFRPGPFICAEWEFGGLPRSENDSSLLTELSTYFREVFYAKYIFVAYSWLLHDEKMVVRSIYQPFIEAVDRYFGKLLPLLTDLQFTRNGPIIMVQVENEYGAYGKDRKYMDSIAGLLKKHEIQELLFTSDIAADLENGQATDGKSIDI